MSGALLVVFVFFGVFFMLLRRRRFRKEAAKLPRVAERLGLEMPSENHVRLGFGESPPNRVSGRLNVRVTVWDDRTSGYRCIATLPKKRQQQIAIPPELSRWDFEITNREVCVRLPASASSEELVEALEACDALAVTTRSA